ncbi:DUF1566 domain-containing protein [Catenovulum sp. 2E275]|uniref:Lcl C-terminal domain-containing protein n=1 Tax=Catenovulum sp. 2E275 TaxID=2980497 RepID=UPI0021D35633|nr:DUF1566 domain-containing protein [Catenovulum sp. 2E275]MCU4675972.1 DUF1566 domain-containing protein [Catenovulum sp. 2E275]
MFNPRHLQVKDSILRAIFVGLMTLLAACSGSLESEDTSDNTQDSSLRVYFNDDIDLPIGSPEFELSAAVKGINPPFTYLWSAQPSRFNSALSASDTETVMFMIPENQTQAEQVLITLKVIDATGNSKTDQMFINITTDNSVPITEFTLNDEDGVIDSGKGFSFEADWIDAEDGELVQSAKVSVEQISGVTLSGLPTDGIIADFPINEGITPAIALITDGQLINSSSSLATLKFTLTVTDTLGGVTTKNVEVDILPAIQSAPVVSAGQNQVVYQGQQVKLTGSVSSGVSTQYKWTQTSGNLKLNLVGTDKANLEFEAPDVTVATTFELQFMATNISSNRRNTDLVYVTVLPISAFDGINDTGITYCADALSNVKTCPISNFPRQDAEFGRDPANNNLTLQKFGQGEAGFDFTLIDDAGEEVFSDKAPSCIRDNVTGLIWEIKTDSGIRSHTHTFTWYLPGDFNGGDEGVASSPSNADYIASCTLNSQITACNTQAYIAAVNASNLCGASDWRLPTVKELVSILNYGQTNNKMALGVNGKVLWPNHAKPVANASPNIPYWTRSSSLFGVSSPTSPIAPRAWVVDLATGDEYSYKKINAAAVLLVR